MYRGILKYWSILSLCTLRQTALNRLFLNSVGVSSGKKGDNEIQMILNLWRLLGGMFIVIHTYKSFSFTGTAPRFGTYEVFLVSRELLVMDRKLYLAWMLLSFIFLSSVSFAFLSQPSYLSFCSPLSGKLLFLIVLNTQVPWFLPLPFPFCLLFRCC